ncbi:hypothetical protein DPEC_G00301320 [Dallia pectoralis]|uniref:Uncharacterized protein n=1 Tax=Dallia pectoralis TaxID=75939 RepID=A0ACC2FGG6_DALPE|nr:hypothetical protein DPEC_G00301320 [Dallia pectoralis]
MAMVGIDHERSLYWRPKEPCSPQRTSEVDRKREPVGKALASVLESSPLCHQKERPLQSAKYFHHIKQH